MEWKREINIDSTDIKKLRGYMNTWSISENVDEVDKPLKSLLEQEEKNRNKNSPYPLKKLTLYLKFFLTKYSPVSICFIGEF